MRFQRGMTALELLVSLLLGAPLMLCAAVLLTTVSTQSAKLKSIERRVTATATIHTLLTRAMNDIETLPFGVTPRIHVGGAIRFTDQTENAVMHGPLVHHPSPKSDALTSVRADVRNSFSVKSYTWSGSSLALQACPRFGFNPATFDDYHSYLILSVDAQLEGVAEGISNAASLAPHCKTFRLAVQKSMFFPDSAQGQIPLVVIPLDTVWTLYVDRQHTLRYLSHAGTRNLENQPILAHAPDLLLTSTTNQSGAQIKADLRFPGQIEEKILLLTLLGPRDSHLNFLFNY
jgi:hypothetical protein